MTYGVMVIMVHESKTDTLKVESLSYEITKFNYYF